MPFQPSKKYGIPRRTRANIGYFNGIRMLVAGLRDNLKAKKGETLSIGSVLCSQLISFTTYVRTFPLSFHTNCVDTRICVAWFYFQLFNQKVVLIQNGVFPNPVQQQGSPSPPKVAIFLKTTISMFRRASKKMNRAAFNSIHHSIRHPHRAVSRGVAGPKSQKVKKCYCRFWPDGHKYIRWARIRFGSQLGQCANTICGRNDNTCF